MSQRMRLFRQHDAAPANVTSTIYRQLTQDWAYLHHLTSTAVAVRRWGRSEPALVGFELPGDIVDAVDRSDNERKNELLLALLRLFQDDKQQLAGRTLLQALLPKLARIASSTIPDADSGFAELVEDSQAITIAEFWNVMAGYPVERRKSRVAQNLALDTLNRVTGQRQTRPALPVDPQLLGSLHHKGKSRTAGSLTAQMVHGVVAEAVVDRDPMDAVTSDTDLMDVIAWAARNSAITLDEAKLLATVYLTDDSPQEWGPSDGRRAPAVIRKRCSRAITKLTAAVRAEMSDITSPTSALVAA